MRRRKVDEFIPEEEMDERSAQYESSIQWHPDMQCTECGDKMFWFENWSKWLCRSWIYMEGGC